MTKDEARAAPRSERVKASHGERKHFRGKMVHPQGGPRAHTHGGHSRSRVGWSQGDYAMRVAETWKVTPARFKKIMPRGRVRFGGAFE